MSFNNDEILILAKAGFNAQQIAALNAIGAAPTPAATMDEILKSVQGLTQTFQNGFIMGAQQPKPVTAEDILANIINPPSPKKEG